MKKTLSNRRGYSLVELIIVLAIVAVLAVMSLVSLTILKTARAKDACVKTGSEINELKTKSMNMTPSDTNYDGYALSYLSIRYLSEILDENEFYDLMSDFNKIRNYGSTIIQDMFNYYTDKFENKMK